MMTNKQLFNLSPSKTQAFHFDDLILHEGQLRPFPEGYFTPSLNEIVKIGIPENRGPINGEKILPDKKKRKLNVKTIVGRRINVLWKSNKKYYKAKVIGYTTNLNLNLVYFDEPTIDSDGNIVDEREDYYQLKLF